MHHAQDNLLAGGWTGMAFSPATWARLNCDTDSGDCAFGPASLTVEASNNQFLQSGNGMLLYMEPQPHHGGLATGVHRLELTATSNAFGQAADVLPLGGETGGGLKTDIDIRLASNTWGGGDGERWDLTDLTTDVDVVDEDGILPDALLTESTCGHNSTLDIYDDGGTRVGGCAPVVD